MKAPEPSLIKLYVMILAVLIVAFSIIQGAYMSGAMAAIGLLFLYYFAKLVKQSEEPTSRRDLFDKRLSELERRVSRVEEHYR